MLARPVWRPVVWVTLGLLVHGLVLAIAISHFGGPEALLGIHDGDYYLHYLRDPLLNSPPPWWDNVTFRAIRFGYIAAALPFRWLGDVPALAVPHFLSVAAGVPLIRAIAERSGGNSEWASAAWILNPGGLLAGILFLPDALAWVLVLGAVLALDSGRPLLGGVLGMGAASVKEASLAATGLAGLWGARRSRKALFTAIGPLVWHLTVLAIATVRFGPSMHRAFLVAPFQGWLEVTNYWGQRSPVLSVAVIALLVAGGCAIVGWIRTGSVFLAAAAGQALLMTILGRNVIFPLENGLLFPLSNMARTGGLLVPLLVAVPRGLRHRD